MPSDGDLPAGIHDRLGTRKPIPVPPPVANVAVPRNLSPFTTPRLSSACLMRTVMEHRAFHSGTVPHTRPSLR